MKLTVLGKYGKYPPTGGANSSYLVSGAAQILVDLGSGAFSRLTEAVLLSGLDCIVLTHLHYDHCSDMFVLGYALNDIRASGELQGPIDVYLPASPKTVYTALSEFDCFNLIPVSDGMKISVKDAELTFLRVPHGVETYALRISDKNGTLAFTADTNEETALEKVITGANAVVGDTCVTDAGYKVGSPHIKASAVAVACKKANATLYLGHLPASGEEFIYAETKKIANVVHTSEKTSYEVF